MQSSRDKNPPLLLTLAGLLLLAGCSEKITQCNVEAETLFEITADVGLTIRLADAANVTLTPDDLLLSDEGLAVAGRTNDGRLWHLKLTKDNCLSETWLTSVPDLVTLTSLSFLQSGRVLAIGEKETGGGQLPSDANAWAAVYDGKAEPLWQKDYGEFLYVSGFSDEPSFEVTQSAYETATGTLLLAGGANINKALYSNWLLWIDAASGQEKKRLNLPRDNPRSDGAIKEMIALPDDGFLLVGDLAGQSQDGRDAWIIELRGDEVVTDRSFGGTQDQMIEGAEQSQIGRFIAGQNDQAAWLQFRDLASDKSWVLMAHSPEKGARFWGLMPFDGELLAYGLGGEAGPAWALAVDPSGKRLWSWQDAGKSGALTTGLDLKDGRLLLGGTSDGAARLIWLDSQGAPRDWCMGGN